MNKYNLADYLATKSTKQLTNLILARINKAENAHNVAVKLQHCEKPRNVKMCNDAKEIVIDCMDWLNDASYYVGSEMWDQIVCDSEGCVEVYGHEEMQQN